MEFAVGAAVRRTRLSTAGVAIVALVAAVLVPIVGVPEAAHADPPAPSSITLVADAATFIAGDTVELTATTDVTVTGTGQTIRIFDDTTSTELEACTSGLECVVDVQFFAGGPHSYYATVGSLESDPVEVARSMWSIELGSDVPDLDADETAEITATANQDVGETDDEYEIFIFNQTTEELLASCSTGDVCVEDSPEFYIDDSPAYEFIAVVAAAGSPETLGDVEDVQATSDPVIVSRNPVVIDLVTDKTDISAGDTVEVTVTADQDISLTNGMYSIHIFEAVSGNLLETCTTGTICSTDYYWSGAGYAVYFVAYVDSNPDPENISDVQGEEIAYGAYGGVNIDAWDVSLTTDKTVLAAGESNTLTASTDQNLSSAAGDLAVYVVDWTTGIIVGSCTTGTSCVLTDHFYKSTDWAYASHGYQAYVAEAGATDPSDLGSEYMMYGSAPSGVSVTSLPWTAEMNLTGGGGDHFQFTVQLNQSPGQTGGQLAFYLYNIETSEYEGQCIVSKRCVITTQHSSASGYYGFVTERVTTHTDVSEAWNVWASAEVSWNALVNGQPVYGPVLNGEGTGGSNPAEKGCQCAHADPVNTATGEFFENISDIDLPGTGPALSLERTYSTSNASTVGPFGFGWSASLDARIEVLIPGDVSNPLPIQVQVVQENGSTALFTRDEASDEYTALGRVKAELSFDSGTGTWTYTRGLIEILTFDDAGLLTSIEDLNGNELTISRDVNDKVSTIEASGGRELTVTWTDDRITSVSDSASRAVSYSYDGNGDLVSVTAVDGAVTSYSYDADHRILTITKPGGGVVTNVYDVNGRISSQTDPLGRETTFGYSDEPWNYARITTITAPDGGQIVEEYVHGVMVSQTRAAGTAYEATTLHTYDADLNVLSTTDPAGAQTTYTYNSDGRMLTQTDALDRTTTWTYDALGNVTSVTDPLERETTYVYDGDGNLLTVEHPGGGIEEWTYNADGTVDTYEDPRGKVTEYSYTAEGWVSSVKDPLGAVTTSVYNDAGFVIESTDALLNVSEMTRDAAGRVLTSTDPLDRTTTTTYDADGNLTSATDPEGGVTSATFDVAGQRLSKTDATGNVTTYTYALGGQIATTTQPGSVTSTNAYNALGQLVSTTDPLGRITYYEYDEAGRLTTTTRPSGAEVTDAYDLAGQLISRTDAAGEITTYEYDDAGQLVSTTDPLNRETVTSYTLDGRVDVVTLPDSSEIAYAYDAAGNIIEVTDPDGYVTTNSYDDRGQLVETERPGAAVTTYTYDLLGRLTVKTLPDATTLTHDYDDAGQLIEIDPSVSGATPITYDYDDAGRRIEMTDSTGTTTATYDAAGRLTSETDGNGNSVEYAYDARGQVTELTYPSSDAVTYSYNNAGEMVSLTDWDARTITFTWTLDGELATRVDPNGVTTTRGYSERGELTSIDVSTTLDELLAVAYAYDDAGQLISREFSGDAYPDSAAEYEYDQLGQLAATDYSGDYESSSGGQLLELANGSSLGYDSAQQLEDITPDSGPTTSFTYDDNGARTSATTGASTTDYEYSAYGALVGVDNGTTALQYRVDGAGLRRERTDGLTTIEFSWATRGTTPLLLADDDYSYVYGPGAAPVAQISGADIEYLYQDIVGSTLLVADHDATSTGYYGYSEYGETIATGGTLATAMQYTGNWADPDSGLLYLRARDYDPVTGQFISVDPLVAETFQPYAYAGNNPLLLTDPLGLATCKGSSDVGCNIGMNLAAIGMGIGDAITFSPIALLFGETSLTGVIRNALGGKEAADELKQNGFYTFGSIWGSAAAGPAIGGITTGAVSLARAGSTGATGLVATTARASTGASAAVAGTRASTGVAGAVSSSAAATSGAVRITFSGAGQAIGHGARHLLGTGLTPAQVEPCIAAQIQASVRGASLTAGAEFRGRLVVEGVMIEFRAFPLPNGSINVGTYYIPK
jgi:RHS repeat-associated protein